MAQKEKSVPIQLPHLPPANLRESITKAEILFALKLVDSHTLLNFCADLNDLLKEAFKDSETAQNMKLSASKASYLINHGLAPYFETPHFQAITKCDFLVAQSNESQ